MGILSGLESFGLKGLESADIFSDNSKKKEEKKAVEVVVEPEITEADLIFEKSFKCPVCDQEFKNKTVKIGKAKLKGTDLDLRPKYEIIDTIKYDVILCPHCGYSALSRYFQYITGPQAKLIKANISASFVNKPDKGDVTEYDEAIEKYKLALANAIVKRSKSSEKAYICLKMAWVVRGKKEALDKNDKDYEAKLARCKEEEDELLQNALDGFLAARQSEGFPMCGMDESTVDYLIAAESIHFGQMDVAAKLVAGILSSPVANKRMKEKARYLKDIMVEQIKNGKK